MSKNLASLPVGLNATTLATIIRIKRKDQVEFTFTDHDRAIPSGGRIYEPANSFSPTQFQSSATLSVDNLDITGIISEIDGITEQDIYSDFFYSAEIWVSQVDYTQPDTGLNKILYGSLGETTLHENKYIVEFRNLTYPLTRKVADMFSKTCRVDFGSERCGIDVEPSWWQSSTQYCPGDYVSAPVYDGKRYLATTNGVSQALGSGGYTAYINASANLVSYWQLSDVLADADWSNVVLACHYNGTNGSTTFTDESTNNYTPTVQGNTQISTTRSKYGGASAKFDGTGDQLTYTYSTDWDITGVDYTIELWLYVEVMPAVDWHAIVTHHNTTTGWRLLYHKDGNLHFATDSGADNGFYTSTGVIKQGQWQHVVAVGYSGRSIAIVDGVVVADKATHSSSTYTGVLRIGATDASNWYMNGYIDDLKITKGTARYTEAFDVPAVPFADDVARVLDSKGSNEGTQINTPTTQVDPLITDTFNSNKAMSFTRANSEYLTVPADATLNNFFASGGGTVEIWMTPTSVIGDSANSGWLINKDDATAGYGTGRSGWGINFHGTSNYIAFFQRFDDGVSTVSFISYKTPNGSIVDGSTYHIVVTYDGSVETNIPNIWLNGVKQTLTANATATATHTASDDSSSPLMIGNCDPAGAQTRYFDGELDDVSLYSTILSDALIEEHYNVGIGIPLFPDFNQTIDGTTVDNGVTWQTKDGYLKQDTVIAPLKIRLNILEAREDLGSGGVYISEFRLFDETGTRIYPASCTSIGSTYINTYCDKLSDDTTGAWAGASPWLNSDHIATLTFSSRFILSSMELETTALSYVAAFSVDVSYDNETTWDTIYEYSGTKTEWVGGLNHLLQIPKADIQVLSRVDIPIAGTTFSDMDYIIDGVLTWITGENAGLSMEVVNYNTTSKTLVLFAPMPYPISFGDTFSVTAGCNHLYLGSDGTTATGHCISRYNNGLNFRGEPYVPTEDVLVGGIGETNKEGYVA